MAVWHRSQSLQQLNQFGQGTLVSRLGIEFVALNEDSLEATMPVDHRTRQPFGLLHGGASVVLAKPWDRSPDTSAPQGMTTLWVLRLTPAICGQ